MENLAHTLHQRREQLGMSQAKLAELAGVSLPTVQRFFSEQSAGASLDTAYKIANALGVTLVPQEAITEQEFLKQHAREKARWLTSVVAGTSALEAQGLTASSSEAVEEKFFIQLMNKPSRIWKS